MASLDDLREILTVKHHRLPMFTVTDHPTDFPNDYVARLCFSLPDHEIAPIFMADPDLDRLRRTLESLGLVRLARHPSDDPVILETWL